MNLKEARRALKVVAKRQGLSEREVVAAIEAAMLMCGKVTQKFTRHQTTTPKLLRLKQV